MTQLKDKTISRETGVIYHGRALIVTLYDRYLEVREKGRREEGVRLDYGTVFELGLKVRANEARRNGEKP